MPGEFHGPGSVEHRLGRLADFPERKIVPVEVNGRTIGVVRSGEVVFAFANRCPHHGAPMCAGAISGTMLPSDPDEFDFGLDGLVVKCPWHAYEFSLRTGEAMGGIIRSRLPTFPTEIRDQEVFCTMRARV